MEPVRVLMRPRQRPCRAREDRNIGAADFGGVERIARRLLKSDIARDGRERADPHIGRRKRHDDRHGVVRGGVGVDQERAH